MYTQRFVNIRCKQASINIIWQDSRATVFTFRKTGSDSWFVFGSENCFGSEKRFIFVVRKCGQVWFRNHARSEKHHALWVQISV